MAPLAFRRDIITRGGLLLVLPARVLPSSTSFTVRLFSFSSASTAIIHCDRCIADLFISQRVGHVSAVLRARGNLKRAANRTTVEEKHSLVLVTALRDGGRDVSGGLRRVPGERIARSCFEEILRQVLSHGGGAPRMRAETRFVEMWTNAGRPELPALISASADPTATRRDETPTSRASHYPIEPMSLLRKRFAVMPRNVALARGNGIVIFGPARRTWPSPASTSFTLSPLPSPHHGLSTKSSWRRSAIITEIGIL